MRPSRIGCGTVCRRNGTSGESQSQLVGLTHLVEACEGRIHQFSRRLVSEFISYHLARLILFAVAVQLLSIPFFVLGARADRARSRGTV